jgi:hypothetical protein
MGGYLDDSKGYKGSSTGCPQMARDRLSDAKVRSAKPAAKPYKLFDGGGLFLLIHPTGSRYWRLKYRIGNRWLSVCLGSRQR